MEFFSGLHQLNDWALVAVRVALGVIFWMHGIVRMLSITEPLGALAVQGAGQYSLDRLVFGI